MIFWKSWHDLRGRFLLCLALVTVGVCPTSIFLAIEENRAVENSVQEETAVSQDQMEELGPRSLAQFVNRWFGGTEFTITFLAVVLSVGGTMSESQGRSNLFTLSLPVKRRRWLTTQWLVAAGMTMCLIVYSAVIFLGVGIAFSVPVPTDVIALGIFTLGLSSLIWIGPGMLSTAIIREPVKAATLVFVLLTAFALLGDVRLLATWNTRSLAMREAWAAGLPWEAMITALIIGGGSLWLAIRRFDRADY